MSHIEEIMENDDFNEVTINSEDVHHIVFQDDSSEDKLNNIDGDN